MIEWRWWYYNGGSQGVQGKGTGDEGLRLGVAMAVVALDEVGEAGVSGEMVTE